MIILLLGKEGFILYIEIMLEFKVMRLQGFLVIALLAVPFACIASEISAKATFYLEKAREKSAPLAERCAAYDSVLSLDSHRNDWNLYMEKANLLGQENHHKESKQIYDQIVASIPSDDIGALCRSVFGRGNMLLYAHNISLAVNDFYKILSIAKPDSLDYWDAKSLMRLSNASYLLGKHEASVLFYNEAAKKYNELSRKGIIPTAEKDRFKKHAHLAKGFIHLEREEYDKAFAEMKKTLDYELDNHQRMVLLLDLGLVFHRKGDLDIASQYYRKVIAGEEPGATSRAQSIINMIDLFLTKNDTDSAAIMIDRHADEIMRRRDDGSKVFWWVNVASTEARTGNYAKAAHAWEQAYRLNDSIKSIMNSTAVSGLMDHGPGAAGELNRATGKENARLKVWLLVSVALILLLSAFAATLWRQRRQERTLPGSRGNGASECTVTAAVTSGETDQELEKYKRQVVVMSMYMEKIDKIFNEVTRDTDGGMVMNADNLDRLRKAVRELSEEQHVWKVFTSYFEEVNQDFFNRIYKINPTISTSEARMCAYMLMKLTTKEIAALTNRSVRTVESTKYNLRKKLRISGNAEEWMHRLSIATPSELETMASFARNE